MDYLKKLRRLFFVVGIVLATANGLKDLNNIVIVSAGGVKFAQGENLLSRGFYHCNAVILDHKDSAAMAHAYFKDAYGGQTPVNSFNFLSYMRKEFTRRGIELKDTEAIISAGSQEDLDRIVNQLETEGIPIRKKQLDNPAVVGSRDVFYNPETDRLEIEYHTPPNAR